MQNSDLQKLAADIGGRKDYFQGAGGNVSVKVSADEMIIKASGVRVSEMDTLEGVVTVAHRSIRDYFHNNEAVAKEEESTKLIQASLLKADGRRPSMETGFHAILGNAVLHTHSVYVNLLTCAADFKEKIKNLFPDTEEVVHKTVGYAAPGHFLTHKMKEALQKDDRNKPLVIFMKNHGITISANTIPEAVTLHELVNKTIKQHLKIQEAFPVSEPLIKITDGHFESQNNYLKEFVRSNSGLLLDISNHMLFPDLIVFCTQLLVSKNHDGHSNSKIIIDTDSGAVTYHTNAKEAAFIEENLVAWCYLMNIMASSGLSPEYISIADADDIQNMEAEKYRKKLVEESKTNH